MHKILTNLGKYLVGICMILVFTFIFIIVFILQLLLKYN